MQEVDAERRLAILRGACPSPPSIQDAPAQQGEGRTGPGPQRKKRKLVGEDDTDRDIRLAREQPDASATVSNSDSVPSARRSTGNNAPLTDRHGHINLFPANARTNAASKNPEAEAETARKNRELEDQYTMRFSNAAGFKQGLEKPWYSSARAAAPADEAVGKNVWGNEDRGRKDRDKARIDMSDPLANMRRGVQQLKAVQRDKDEWQEERRNDFADPHRRRKRESRSRRRRDEEMPVTDGFQLDAVHSAGDDAARSRGHERRRHGHHTKHQRHSSHDRDGHRPSDREIKARSHMKGDHDRLTTLSEADRGRGGERAKEVAPAWEKGVSGRYSNQFVQT